MFTSCTLNVVARATEAFERLSVQSVTATTHSWPRHELLLCLESPVDTKHKNSYDQFYEALCEPILINTIYIVLTLSG